MNSRSTTRSWMKSISASALASMSSLLSSTSANCSTSRSPQVSGVTLSSSASLVRKRVEREPLRRVRREVLDVLERRGLDAQLLVQNARRCRRSLPGWSRKQRSGPFTLKQTAAIEPFSSGKCVKIDASSHSTALVLVASPDTPVMLRCAASGPSRKSASR